MTTSKTVPVITDGITVQVINVNRKLKEIESRLMKKDFVQEENRRYYGEREPNSRKVFEKEESVVQESLGVLREGRGNGVCDDV